MTLHELVVVAVSKVVVEEGKEEEEENSYGDDDIFSHILRLYFATFLDMAKWQYVIHQNLGRATQSPLNHHDKSYS